MHTTMKYNDKPNWDTLDKILSVSTDPNQYHKIDIYKLWLSVVMLNLYDEDRFDKIAEIADKLNVSFNDKSNSDYLMSRLLLSICYRELQEWDKSLETLLFINDMQIGIANDYGDESNNVISKSFIVWADCSLIWQNGITIITVFYTLTGFQRGQKNQKNWQKRVLIPFLLQKVPQ